MAKKAKVLIIEDDKAFAQGFATILKAEGYQVLHAYDGAEAIKIATEELPDLILLDVILPVKTGEEVIDELKGSDKTKHIPVIVDSNLYSTEREHYFLHKGALTYLQKTDISPESLVKLVAAALEK